MTISGIDKIGNMLNVEQMTKTMLGNKVQPEQPDFSTWLKNEISTANTQVNQADTKLREFALGKTDNVHEVMMALEKAKTSFELVVEVRNRLLEGYQEIMRMQI